MTRWVALLRGINVGGHRKIRMADLRALADSLGWHDVATYIQSGNLVFSADGDAAALSAALTAGVAEHFGHDVPVAVRSAESFAATLAALPWPDRAAERGKWVHVGLSAAGGCPSETESLSRYAVKGEAVHVAGGALWIDYPEGLARTKLTPAVLDRWAGGPITFRNWNTAQRVLSLLNAS